MNDNSSLFLKIITNALSNLDNQHRKYLQYNYHLIDIMNIHYINKLVSAETFLIIGDTYGYICNSLIDLKKDFISVDKNEINIQFLSNSVRQKFKVIDGINNSIDFGKFDCVISCFPLFNNSQYYEFLIYHAKKYIFLFNDDDYSAYTNTVFLENEFMINDQIYNDWLVIYNNVKIKYKNMVCFYRDWIDPNLDIGQIIEE